MKDFILTHYPIIKQVIFYLSIVYVALFTFFTVPVMLGHLRLVRIHFNHLVKLYRSDKSTATQLKLIADQTSSIQHTIDAAFRSSDLSSVYRSEMEKMLVICEIIRRNAPHSLTLIDSYLDDLDELLERLEEIVPPNLHRLNPYFVQTTPPKLSPLKWCQQKVRFNFLMAHVCSFASLSQLINATHYPRLLDTSFIFIVSLAFYTVYLHRCLQGDYAQKNRDEVCLKHYQEGYNHVLFILLLTLMLYVLLRFLLFV